jgi:hypothetical protein
MQRVGIVLISGVCVLVLLLGFLFFEGGAFPRLNNQGTSPSSQDQEAQQKLTKLTGEKNRILEEGNSINATSTVAKSEILQKLKKLEGQPAPKITSSGSDGISSCEKEAKLFQMIRKVDVSRWESKEKGCVFYDASGNVITQ